MKQYLMYGYTTEILLNSSYVQPAPVCLVYGVPSNVRLSTGKKSPSPKTPPACYTGGRWWTSSLRTSSTEILFLKGLTRILEPINALPAVIRFSWDSPAAASTQMTWYKGTSVCISTDNPHACTSRYRMYLPEPIQGTLQPCSPCVLTLHVACGWVW